MQLGSNEKTFRAELIQIVTMNHHPMASEAIGLEHWLKSLSKRSGLHTFVQINAGLCSMVYVTRFYSK